jgi:hypothetical protein
MLDAILTIFMLVSEGQRKHEMSAKRLNMLLDIIEAVEGKEPSDNTFLKFQNIMNASTNLLMNLLFLIRAPEVVPLVLIAFSKSTRLDKIVKYSWTLESFLCRIYIHCISARFICCC